MRPQIRTYILFVGRDADDKPYRALAPYLTPVPGLTDSFDQWSHTRLAEVRRFIEAERELLEQAAEDLEHEAYRRLEAMTE